MGLGSNILCSVDSFQTTRRGLRNYAAPILFFLRPVPKLWVSPSERFSSVSGAQGQLIGYKLLYCHTLSFQKESVGPHLGNRDVNTYKRRCLNLELYKYWSFYPFSFSVVFCMLFFFSSSRISNAILESFKLKNQEKSRLKSKTRWGDTSMGWHLSNFLFHSLPLFKCEVELF